MNKPNKRKRKNQECTQNKKKILNNIDITTIVDFDNQTEEENLIYYKTICNNDNICDLTISPDFFDKYFNETLISQNTRSNMSVMSLHICIQNNSTNLNYTNYQLNNLNALSISINCISLFRSEYLNEVLLNCKNILQELDLTNYFVLDENLKIISDIVTLKNLKLKLYNEINQIKFLSNLTNLEVLHIYHSCLINMNFEIIFKLSKLKELVMTFYNINFNNFDMLLNLNNLETLCIYCCSLRDKHIEIISKLSNLKELKFSSHNINVNKFKMLLNLTNLEILHISHSNLSNNHVQIISQFCKLKELKLKYCNITNEGLKYLIEFTDKKKIYFKI